MPDVNFLADERYVTGCDTAYCNGHAFPGRGMLHLTNQRVIYHKIGLGLYMLAGPLWAQKLKGKQELAFFLADIENIVQERHRGNPRCLKFTLKDGKEYIFAVNKKFQEEVSDRTGIKAGC